MARATNTAKQQAIVNLKTDKPHLSTTEIAKSLDTSHSYVVETLKRYGINYTYLEKYKNSKADIWHGISQRLLSSITDEEIQKEPVYRRVVAAGIAFDKASVLDGLHPDHQPLVIINQIKVGQVDKDQDKVIDVQVEG